MITRAIDVAGSIQQTIGATFIGTVLAAALYGATCIQCYTYYTVYHRDPLYLKLLVATVVFTDTVHQALITHSVYMYTIAHFSDRGYLTKLVWSMIVEVIIKGITALLVQSFFIMRIWTLSHGNIAMLILTVVSVTAQFALHIVYVAQGVHITLLANLPDIKGVSLAINGVTAFTDILITTCMIWLLQRSRTSNNNTNTLITRLIIYTANTGIITSLDAVLSLITILAKPNALIYLGIYYMIGRLYSNSLIATLNSRSSLRGVAEGTRDFDGSLVAMSNLQWTEGRRFQASGTRIVSSKADIGTTADFRCDILGPTDSALHNSIFTADITSRSKGQDNTIRDLNPTPPTPPECATV